MRHLLIALLGATVLLGGCATTTKTETRKVYAEARTVVPGDQVRITTKDGAKTDFVVTAADETKIQGKHVSIARADIASIKSVQTTTVTTKETSAAPAVQAISVTAIVIGVISVVAILALF
jgi:ABC-type amino acid transport substrate-binding protein